MDQSGVYQFDLHADDEALLRVNGEEVMHTYGDSDIGRTAYVALEPGTHALELEYLELGEEQTLQLDWFLQEETDTRAEAQLWIEDVTVPFAPENELPQEDEDEDALALELL